MVQSKVKRGRPKGSKNRPKIQGIPRSLKRSKKPETELPNVKAGRFEVEVVQDEISSILYRELKIDVVYLIDTWDGQHGRYIARFFDERLAKLTRDFLNGHKRVPRRFRETVEKELDTEGDV